MPKFQKSHFFEIQTCLLKILMIFSIKCKFFDENSQFWASCLRNLKLIANFLWFSSFTTVFPDFIFMQPYLRSKFRREAIFRIWEFWAFLTKFSQIFWFDSQMVECSLHIRHRFDQNLPFFDREISISNVIKINKHSVPF